MRSFLLGLACMILLASPSLAADRLVRFSAASVAGQADAKVEGYLTRPKGAGRFAAVVVLHSCLGMRADRAAMAQRLANWGYVALFVDDFSTRGLRDSCAVEFPEGLADAVGAVGFVARLPDVDPARIAVVGYSQGAATALQIAAGSAGLRTMPDQGHIAAVAAYYPACVVVANVRLQIPTLVLVGANDSVTPAAACQQLARQQAAGTMKLVVYPDAGHVFDDPQFAGGKALLGMRLQYDRKAAVQAQTALHDFLAARLAR
jgi:dienelactone hydrolase